MDNTTFEALVEAIGSIEYYSLRAHWTKQVCDAHAKTTPDFDRRAFIHAVETRARGFKLCVKCATEITAPLLAREEPERCAACGD